MAKREATVETEWAESEGKAETAERCSRQPRRRQRRRQQRCCQASADEPVGSVEEVVVVEGEGAEVAFAKEAAEATADEVKGQLAVSVATEQQQHQRGRDQEREE